MVLSYLLALFTISLVQGELVINRPSFSVDYENSRFLMDGEPFQYASGEIHYFRIPRAYWKDRLHKVRAAGFNAIQTYVEWSSHEPVEGQYNFEGELDLEEFINIAQSEGLAVILRPGPYICAEREFGGFPSWLLGVNPKMAFRTSDPSYTFYVEKWFSQLFPRIQPHLYGNGGNIIMVQIENEYGSYPVNDQKYLRWLRDLMTSYIGDDAVLFTTDGPSESMVTRGHIPGVLGTIDFGVGYTDMNATYANLRKIQPNGPLVNSEYYSGWLMYWGQEFPTIPSTNLSSVLREMLDSNISVSMYMVHGGTNFGFMAGSGSDEIFEADTTSYDYDAPISEAGDLTPKYFAIQDVLKDYFPIINMSSIPAPKGKYGKVKLSPIVNLFDSPTSAQPQESTYPLTFEELGQRFGFLAYTTTISNLTLRDPSVLQVVVRDRAIIYLNNIETSTLMYTLINETPLPPWFRIGQELTILVENLGRRNYQLLSDCTKGIVANATVNGVVLKNWTMQGYPLTTEDIQKVEALEPARKTPSAPLFLSGKFTIPKNEDPRDTFLDMTGWGKGFAFINGFNLGRYWHLGPQGALYTPGCYLKPYPEKNTITILELHYTPSDFTIQFIDTPMINKTVGMNVEDIPERYPEYYYSEE